MRKGQSQMKIEQEKIPAHLKMTLTIKEAAELILRNIESYAIIKPVLDSFFVSCTKAC